MATRRWDSVGGGTEEVIDVDLDPDGTVTVLVASDSQAWLLGYNGDALAPTFEVLLGSVDQKSCGLVRHDGGPTYVAQKQGANVLVRQFDGSGGVNWSRTISQTDPFVGDLERAPSGGVVYCGSSGTRAFARHYSSAGAQQWTYTALGDNSPNNLMRRVFVESDGSAVGIGTNDGSGAPVTGTAFFRIATNGVGVAVDVPATDGQGMSLVKRSTNLYYRLSVQGSADSVYSFDRTNDATALLSSMTGAADEIAIDTVPNRYYVNNYTTQSPASSGSRVFVSNNSISNFFSSQLQIQDFTVGAGASVVGVGNRNRDASYVLFEGTASPQMFDLPVLGYTAREVESVAHDPNGAAYVGTTFSDSGGGVQSTLTKFNAAGNLLWYRNFSVPSGRFRIRKVMRGADGDVVIAGFNEINGRLHVRKLDGATGTQLWVREHFTIGADVLFADASLGLGDAVYIASIENLLASLTQVKVRKLSASTGLLLNSNDYAYLYSEVEQVQVQATAGGAFVTSLHGIGTDARALHKVYNVDFGFMSEFVYNGSAVAVKTKPAANGEVALAYLNDAGLLSGVRFNASTFATEVDGSLTSRAIPIFIDVSANENMVLLSGHSGGGYRIASLSGGNGSQLWDTVVEPTVNALKDLSMDGANNAFILGEEPQAGNIQSAYAARYLSTGVRSAQRRLAGDAVAITNPAASQVWLFGDAPTRNQARQITLTRYNY